MITLSLATCSNACILVAWSKSTQTDAAQVSLLLQWMVLEDDGQTCLLHQMRVYRFVRTIDRCSRLSLAVICWSAAYLHSKNHCAKHMCFVGMRLTAFAEQSPSLTCVHKAYMAAHHACDLLCLP